MPRGLRKSLLAVLGTLELRQVSSLKRNLIVGRRKWVFGVKQENIDYC